ncbi:fha domain-containing protein [Nannochloropsis gaditana]|uniref:E3 ubiquitin-protein ligase CHFR n=1 Tax=Nannochloropsis gaditana TaxID=72520 RepID=W7TPZ6_9STRA|nr:fha domain-containing protein [Nannochloropsis gaditana]
MPSMSFGTASGSSVMSGGRADQEVSMAMTEENLARERTTHKTAFLKCAPWFGGVMVLETMAPAASINLQGHGGNETGHKAEEFARGAVVDDGIERTLCLVEPKPSARQPQDKIPTLIHISRTNTSVGRSVKADVVLSHGMTQNTISRRHAEILVSPEKSTYIQDVGSLNGVFINRVKIRKARLHSGDMIQFGGAAGLQEGAELGPVCSKAIMYRYVERDVGKGKERADQRNAFEGHVGDRARIVARDQERGKHEGEMLEGNGNMRAHNGKKRRRTAQGVHVASKEDRESSQQLHFDQNLESSRSKESMEARIATLQKALASAQQCQKKVFTAVGFSPSSDYQEAITALLNAVQVGREAEGRVQELETIVGAERAAKEQARQALREKDAALMVAEARVDAALAQLQEGKHVAEDQSTVKQRAAEEAVKMLQAKTAQAEALKRELKNTRRSKTALQRQLDKCRAVKTSGRSQQAKGDKGGQEEILQVLEAELGCALCSEIVMDAGVLPCSHAFCFSCVHRYLKAGPDKDPEETLRDLEVHGQCQRGLQQGVGAKGGPPDVEKGGEAFTNRAHPRACPDVGVLHFKVVHVFISTMKSSVPLYHLSGLYRTVHFTCGRQLISVCLRQKINVHCLGHMSDLTLHKKACPREILPVHVFVSLGLWHVSRIHTFEH